MDDILIVTTNDVPGYEITQVHGEVCGLIVRARNAFSNIGAGLRTVFGGEARGYTHAAARQPQRGDRATARGGAREGRERRRRDALRLQRDRRRHERGRRLRHRRHARPPLTCGKRNAPNAIRSLTRPRLRALVPKDFQHPGGASSASDSAPGARRTVGGRTRPSASRPEREKALAAGKALRRLRAASADRLDARRPSGKRNDRTPAVSSTLPAYRCLERLLYPCKASTYFGWRSVQGGSYGTGPCRRKRPPIAKKRSEREKLRRGSAATDLRAILGTAWSGVRAAEGARLEIAWAGLTRLEGSNPSHSVRGAPARRERSARPLAFRGVSRAYSSAGERPLHTREVLGSIPSTPIARSPGTHPVRGRRVRPARATRLPPARHGLPASSFHDHPAQRDVGLGVAARRRPRR